MKLVWEDNFDYTGPPNPDKWEAQVGGHGWGNNELQYYTDMKNVWAENGKLIIEARREDCEGKEVTSARIRTAGKGDWKYGRIEVCAKLPSGLGTWPAIWMMPTPQEGAERVRWPDCGEVDIMEHVGFRQGNVFATVHTGAFNHTKRTHLGGGKEVADCSEAFHVYSCEWDEKEMRFAIDGEQIFRYAPWEMDTVSEVTDAEWPFNKPFHLILNVAFGGNLGGARGIDMDVLPQRFEIDYVRVYQ